MLAELLLEKKYEVQWMALAPGRVITNAGTDVIDKLLKKILGKEGRDPVPSEARAHWEGLGDIVTWQFRKKGGI